jgi:tetratricopeptide (TPR) repeat protein
MEKDKVDNIDRWFMDDHPEHGKRVYRLERRGTVLALYCNEEPVPTPPNPLRLLESLLDRKFGTTIEKAKVALAVWPDANQGGDLNGLIGDLRTLLLDSRSPGFPKWRLVQSGAKNGLRFGGKEVPARPAADTHQDVLGVIEDGGNRPKAGSPRAVAAPPIRLKGLNDFPHFENLRPGDLLRLLDPAFRAFDLAGRKQDSQALLDWLHGEASVSFQVLIGHGGRGKTRLAIHILEKLQDESGTQWHAGFLDQPLSEEPFRQWEFESPTLIIIDEASRYADVLAEEVIPRLRHLQPDLPLRFLLIDRGADEITGWYRKVLTAGRILFPNPPLRLLELDARSNSNIAEREQLLESALARLSQISGKPKPTIDAAARTRLGNPEMGDPLILCMAAVVGCERGDLSALAWRRIQLAEYLVDREEERISMLAKPTFLPLHMTAYVSLCGGLTADELLAACDQERSAVQPTSQWEPIELAQLISGTVLPPDPVGTTQPESAETLLAAQPIVPDVLSEVFLERVFRDPYQQPSETIHRAFRQKPGPVVRTLVHMVQDFASAEGDDTLPRQKRALDWLASLLQSDVESLSPDDLWQIDSALPNSESVALAEVAHGFYKTILGIAELPEWLYALAVADLARWEYHLGNDAESLRLSTCAVQKYQELVDSYSDFYFVEELGKSLTGHVVALKNNGLNEDALKASLTAVQLCREVQEDRAGYLWALAPALVLHASAWDHLGQHDKALEAVSEAIHYYRDELLGTNRDAYLPWFAIALRDQSSYHFELGQYSKALEAAKEALSCYRELARLQPDTYQPRLALAIEHHARVYRFHWDDPNSARLVLPWIEEAVTISRSLLTRNRQMFLHDASGILLNYGIACHLVPGREAEAEQLVQEAAGCYAELVQRNPQRYREALLVCQTVQVTHLTGSGKTLEALDLIDQAIDNARALAKHSHPNSSLRLLHALGTKTHLLQKQGRSHDALITILEAASYGEELVHLNPGRYLRDLATTYSISGRILMQLGETSQAVEKFAKALRHIKPLGLRYPEANGNFARETADEFETAYFGLNGRWPDAGFTAPFSQLLPENNEAKRLQLLRESFHQIARHQLPSIAKYYREQASVWGESMLELAEEVMQRYTTLPEDEFAAGIVILKERADGLMARVEPWRAAGFVDEALQSVREAIPILRLLAQEDPLIDRHKAVLASALFTEGQLLDQLGRATDALEPIEEATSRLGALAENDADAYRPGLLNWLPTKLRLQYDLGHKPQALETTRILIDLARGLAEKEPEVFPRQLMRWLTCQQELQAELGQPSVAAETTAAITGLFRQFLTTNRAEFLPQLWKVLIKQATFQETAKQYKTLVATTRDATAVLRELVTVDRDTYRRHLPHALCVQANALDHEGGHDAEAMLALEEAFEHFRDFALTNPEWLEQDALTGALRNSSSLWCRLVFRSAPNHGRDKFSEQLRLSIRHVCRSGQLRPIEFPLPILRAGYILACRKARSKPDLNLLARIAIRFAPHRQSVPIGIFIPNHKNSQQPVEISLEESREQIEAALALDRESLSVDDDDNRIALAMSLQTAAEVLAQLKRTREALKHLREAEKYFRASAQSQPTLHRKTLAGALQFQAEVHLTLGKKRAALNSITESVQTCRQLLSAGADAASGLAAALACLASVQQENGKKVDGVETTLEAVGYYVGLASEEPATYAARLYDALQPLLAQIKYKVFVSPRSVGLCPMVVKVFLPTRGERLQRTLALLDQHIEQLNALTTSHQDLFLQTQADLERSRFLSAIGASQNHRALESIEDTMRHHEQLAASKPAVFLPVVAWMYCLWATLVWRQGDNDRASIMKAADLLLRSLKIISPLAQHAPQAHGSLLDLVRRAYSCACRAAGLPPDVAVLGGLDNDAKNGPTVH